jgi:hypothetical protein
LKGCILKIANANKKMKAPSRFKAPETAISPSVAIDTFNKKTKTKTKTLVKNIKKSTTFQENLKTHQKLNYYI